MSIDLNNNSSVIKSLISGKINQNIDSTGDLYVLHLIHDWLNGKKEFVFHSSGSTGKKKCIKLHRNQLEYSARTTLKYLDPLSHFKTSLLCLPPQFIGGTMVVIRALIGKMVLEVQEPSSLPQIDQDFDLVSMVPMQVINLLDQKPESFRRIQYIIIGGAALEEKYISALMRFEHLNVFTSYGMTETASHIALRNLRKENTFHLLGDIKAKMTDGSLLLTGTVTNNKTLYTNDIVSFTSNDAFVYKGRKDNVINTGGFKVFPEEVEQKLSKIINTPFFITKTSDKLLGELVTLVIENDSNFKLPDFNKSDLSKFEYPRKVLHIPSFVYTETQKINRIATLSKIKL